MTIQIVKGDAVKALQQGDIQCLLHVVNCKGVMGSGIAKQIKETFPKVYSGYSGVCATNTSLLGKCIRVFVDTEHKDGFGLVHNLFAQDGYGRDKRHLNYGALSDCLRKFLLNRGEDHVYGPIGLPYKMGCDRAGGDWSIVLEMIEYYLEGRDVRIYKL